MKNGSLGPSADAFSSTIANEAKQTVDRVVYCTSTIFRVFVNPGAVKRQK
jgi:hypothetical protein